MNGLRCDWLIEFGMWQSRVVERKLRVGGGVSNVLNRIAGRASGRVLVSWKCSWAR